MQELLNRLNSHFDPNIVLAADVLERKVEPEYELMTDEMYQQVRQIAAV